MGRPLIAAIIRQHVDDVVDLHSIRSFLVHHSTLPLREIRRFDDRLAAHVDGLVVAGGDAWRFCETEIADSPRHGVFAATVCAILNRDRIRFGRLCVLADVSPDAWAGVISGLGWVSRAELGGIELSGAKGPVALAVAASAAHMVDPGKLLGRLLECRDPITRARALRTAGMVGRDELLGACLASVATEDLECRFWSAWSSVLLGDRSIGLDYLVRTGMGVGERNKRALGLALQAMSLADAHRVLTAVAQQPERLSLVIACSGIAGDPAYVPWLIEKMTIPSTAQKAAESFTLITGLDIELDSLARGRPPDVKSGPNDNPHDANVQLDGDDGLPWPDAKKIEAWWAANGHRFQKGTRYFMGAPVTREHCIEVLKTGYQRQRILAAHYLCLLDPGTPLFNTSAPAWRQQRWLAKM